MSEQDRRVNEVNEVNEISRVFLSTVIAATPKDSPLNYGRE